MHVEEDVLLPGEHILISMVLEWGNNNLPVHGKHGSQQLKPESSCQPVTAAVDTKSLHNPAHTLSITPSLFSYKNI
jgi:hypothetical protein